MKYHISAVNKSGAYTPVGGADTIKQAVSLARNTMGKGWKITIARNLDGKKIKEWTVR